MTAIIKPRRPSGTGWSGPYPVPEAVTLGYDGEWWKHDSGLKVISAVEVAKDTDGIDRGPEYHVSISRRPARAPAPVRCSTAEALWVLGQFDLIEAEEDNHVPSGVVRNFWRPVADQFVGMNCACKDTEPAIKEDKGDYVWRGVERT